MGLLRNLKISRKLMVFIIIEICTLVIVGLSGLYAMREMAQKSEAMYNDRLIPNQWLGEIRENSRGIDNDLLQSMIATDNLQNDSIKMDIDILQEQTDNALKNLSHAHLSTKELKKIEEYKKGALELQDLRQQVLDLAMENKNDEAYQFYSETVLPKSSVVNSILIELQKLNNDVAKQINDENEKSINQTLFIILGIVLISLIIAIGIGLLITRMIVKPTKDVMALLSKAEKGDLTVRGTYQSKDEMGNLTTSFNNMMKQLNHTITTVSGTSQLVAAASEQLTASADQTTAATEHVASAIQEIASGAEQSTSMLERNADSLNEVLQGVLTISDSSTKVSEISRETAAEAEEGGKSVEENLSQMKYIHQSVQKSNEVIQSLSDRSNEIGKILEVISGISDQTNLLALNAAIEAARAGEHGKGFAVVADEVRKLAEQSQSSTKLIADLINSIQVDINNSIGIMNEVMVNAEQGVKVSVETSNKFIKIIERTRNITPQIEDITATVQQISASVEEVSTSAKNIAVLSQENASSSEEVAASTEEQLASMEEINSSSKSLADMAEELKEIVNKFVI